VDGFAGVCLFTEGDDDKGRNGLLQEDGRRLPDGLGASLLLQGDPESNRTSRKGRTESTDSAQQHRHFAGSNFPV
jgi:hypothetical protein